MSIYIVFPKVHQIQWKFLLEGFPKYESNLISNKKLIKALTQYEGFKKLSKLKDVYQGEKITILYHEV